jgi:16S rRNA C967 or C1407 C5-methylase (RsmB/RsmF family)
MNRRVFAPWIKFHSDFFTPTQIDSMIRAFSNPRHLSFRINELKVTSPAMKRELLADIQATIQEFRKNVFIVSCPWYSYACYLSQPSILVRHLAPMVRHKAGCFYLQSLSSMIPVNCMDIKKNHRILDMCAAPGGKTSQIIASLMGSGKTVAVEIDKERHNHLERNIKRLLHADMMGSVKLLLADSRHLPESNQYDRILLDAPCSGDGRFFIEQPSTFEHWSSTFVKKHVYLQRQLLASAYKLLKPGGELVYSTCALSKDENEGNINWFTSNFNMEIIDLAVDLLDASENGGQANFTQAIDMPKALRVFPTELYEGFFVCRLRKVE